MLFNKCIANLSKLCPLKPGAETTNLGLCEVCAEVHRPGTVVHPDLHVVVADAVHDDPLELKGVAERGQLQETLEAHALVDL